MAQVVEYYGDSTIRGYESGTGGQVAKPAPQAFAEALPASPRQQVNNLGVDGQTACALVDTGWNDRMATSNATVVILNHGINDAVNEVGISRYKSCLTTLAQTARNYSKRVIFETPNPVDNGQVLNTYVTAMKEVAAQENLPVIDQYTNLINSGRSIREMSPDGTHPSSAVYIEKGRYAASVYVTIPL
ncbi:MAG: major pilin protein fimA [Herminiimonas sp.]|nr:major pilin protein fimA [Herminiimonas sp.]